MILLDFGKVLCWIFQMSSIKSIQTSDVKMMSFWIWISPLDVVSDLCQVFCEKAVLVLSFSMLDVSRPSCWMIVTVNILQTSCKHLTKSLFCWMSVKVLCQMFQIKNWYFSVFVPSTIHCHLVSLSTNFPRKQPQWQSDTIKCTGRGLSATQNANILN